MSETSSGSTRSPTNGHLELDLFAKDECELAKDAKEEKRYRARLQAQTDDATTVEMYNKVSCGSLTGTAAKRGGGGRKPPSFIGSSWTTREGHQS